MAIPDEGLLHIVSFDVPYPADYGGVTDVLFKLIALRETGHRVILHCFQYQRPTSQALEHYAEAVYYYPRRLQKHLILQKWPFIVSTRKSEKLVETLAGDEHPVLFEGLHTCHHLKDPRIAHKPKFVRLHNVEHEYYQALSQAETNHFKKNFFRLESKKLKNFERELIHADGLLPISRQDTEYYAARFPNVHYLPPFHDNRVVEIPGEPEAFSLYHGNLGVAENEKAARFLVDEVFSRTDKKLIIAGNAPSASLRSRAESQKNVQLIENPNKDRIHELIGKAWVNILPTFQGTGIKLKLLNALFRGHHCIVNGPMVERTGLEPLCHRCEDPLEMANTLDMLMERSLDEEEKEVRRKILEKEFSNKANAERFRKILFPMRQPLSPDI